MVHDEAIRVGAAERYVAGELAPAERGAFEEHFFDCPECVEEVRWEMIFAANARAVLPKRAAMSSKPGWWGSWLACLRPRRALALSLAANAVLALGFGFVLITGARDAMGPRLIPAYFAPGPAHNSGDMQVHSIPAGIAAFLARIPSAGPKYSSYSYEILDTAGKREAAGTVNPAADQDSELYLEVPVGGLPGGVHTLAVRGKPGDRIISRSKFHISR